MCTFETEAPCEPSDNYNRCRHWQEIEGKNQTNTYQIAEVKAKDELITKAKPNYTPEPNDLYSRQGNPEGGEKDLAHRRNNGHIPLHTMVASIAVPFRECFVLDRGNTDRIFSIVSERGVHLSIHTETEI